MSPMFPQHTGYFKAQPPRSAFRKLTLSLVEMAVITGVLLRLYRAAALTHGSSSLLFIGGSFALGALVYFGMATLHLGNYTLRRWLWRVPAFALVESAAEMAASALLIALHREPLGTGRAELADWPRMATYATGFRVAALVLFAAVLAGVVQLVRRALLRREHRESMALAIHRTAEHGEG